MGQGDDTKQEMERVARAATQDRKASGMIKLSRTGEMTRARTDRENHLPAGNPGNPFKERPWADN